MPSKSSRLLVTIRLMLLMSPLVFIPSLSGCVQLQGLKNKNQAISYYTIAYPSPSPVCSEPLGGVTLLKRFTVASMYSTDRLLIQPSPFAADYYYYSRWAVNPGSMITDFLYRDISASGLFSAVLTGPGFLRPDYELAGTLETFQVNKIEKGWEAELTLNILFFPHPSDSKLTVSDEIYQKRYVTKIPCPAQTPESIVTCLSTCMAEFSKTFLNDMKVYLGSK